MNAAFVAIAPLTRLLSLSVPPFLFRAGDPQELADVVFRKKAVLCVWRCRFLLLVWGFVSAIKQSR